MTWNYRIVRYPTGDSYGLHEVFYGDDGEPTYMSEQPCGFVCGEDEGIEGIIDQLQNAIKDAKTKPIFDPPESWSVK